MCGLLYLVVDDTLLHKRGKHVYGLMSLKCIGIVAQGQTDGGRIEAEFLVDAECGDLAFLSGVGIVRGSQSNAGQQHMRIEGAGPGELARRR